MYLVGTSDAIRLARSMGVSTLKNDGSYGLTLVLGGGEATLLDMTSSYGVFANDGKRVEPTAILKVTDSTGKELFNYTPVESQVLEADAARRINSVLSDNAARSSLFGANSLLNISGRPAAVKTGTTNNNKDAWMIGYNSNVVIGVWSGNNDNTPMKKGSIISGSTWRDTMNTALGLYGYTPFAAPNGIGLSTKPVLRGKWWGNESVMIDKISGKKATEYTPTETLDEIVQSNPHNILYWINKNDPTGPAPLIPSSDSQYERWEAGFQKWLTNNPGIIPATKPVPNGSDDVHTPENSPKVEISSANLQMNSASGVYELSLEFSVRDKDLNQINIVVDGDTLETLPSTATVAKISLPTDATTGKTTLTVGVEGVDMVYNKGSAETSVAI
jgi:membrane peptidoglycan carboxypeptidase